MTRYSAGEFTLPLFLVLIAAISTVDLLRADEPVPPVEIQLAFADSATVQTPPQSLADVLKLCLLQALDDEYVEDRHWGKTAERFDGFRVRGLRVSKRERAVNHGFWHRYKARLIRPEETLQVHVSQQAGADGTILCTVLVTLRAHCEATFAWWNWGVKGWNGTTDADASVQMRLVIETRPQLKFSLTEPIPRLDLSPRVTQVTLKLKDIDLRRIGILEGPVVTSLADGSRKTIEDLLQSQEGKIQSRLQKKIDEIVTGRKSP